MRDGKNDNNKEYKTKGERGDAWVYGQGRKRERDKTGRDVELKAWKEGNIKVKQEYGGEGKRRNGRSTWSKR